MSSSNSSAYRTPLTRTYGGMRFPDKAPPEPGPLARLAAELTPPAKRASPEVERMLAALPTHLRTQNLQRAHRRVLERIAAVWREPRSLRRVLDGLMYESDPAQRLDFQAVVELTELKDYFMRSLYVERVSIWDEALGLV